MSVIQFDGLVNKEQLYTVLQIKPKEGSPIVLPQGDNLNNKVMAVLRGVAPEYFTEKHSSWGTRWDCQDIQSDIKAFYGDFGVYSNLDTQVFIERLKPEDALKRDNPGGEDVLGRKDLDGETLAADAVKTLVVKHELGGYKTPKFDDSGGVIEYHYDGTMPNLNSNGAMGGFCDVAYEIVFAAILTKRSIKEVVNQSFRLVNVGWSQEVTVSVDNPTAERVEKAARELRTFLNYAVENKEGITLIAAQVYNALKGNKVFTEVGEHIGVEGAKERMTSFAGETLQEATRVIDPQIVKLPTLDRSLMQYLYNPGNIYNGGTK